MLHGTSAAKHEMFRGTGSMTPARLPLRLVEVLAGLPGIALAFSGGIDSRFLAFAAKICGCRLLAIHAAGPHVPPGDSAFAKNWLAQNRINYLVVNYSPLALPEVASNSRLRCYACKKGLFAAMKAALAQSGFAGSLCDGSQLDDCKVYRPGRKALAEAGIVSPLLLAGLSKRDIREAAGACGLDDWKQKARPCLLTRLAYGLKPQAETLARVAACEAELARLFANGADFRLRLTPEPILQVEGGSGEKWEEAKAIMALHGFADAKLVISEKISGFFDI